MRPAAAAWYISTAATRATGGICTPPTTHTVAGRLYALRNRCPHKGGALCQGPVTGTALSGEGFRFAYGRGGEIVRCAWHGWEFEIATGHSIVDPRVCAKAYPVEVKDGAIYVAL